MDGRGETRNSAHKADGYPDSLKYHGSKSTMLSAESVLCVHPKNWKNLAILKYVIDIIKKILNFKDMLPMKFIII